MPRVSMPAARAPPFSRMWLKPDSATWDREGEGSAVSVDAKTVVTQRPGRGIQSRDDDLQWHSFDRGLGPCGPVTHRVSFPLL
ncbi:hypothetical protein VTI74DRAFT_1436 [Chaetomium olivicolor]